MRGALGLTQPIRLHDDHGQLKPQQEVRNPFQII